jgi:TonB family protein
VELVLDALRHGLVVPNPLGLTVYTAMVSSQGAVMVPAVYGEIEFTLDREGKMLDAHLTQSSMSPALDRSFYDAARRADSMQAFPAQIGVPNPGSIRFYVSFSPFDTHAAQSMPFFAVRMPAWKPAARPGINAARDMKPVFPVAARNAAVGDSVTIQFVVDEHGAPVKSTMRLLSAAHIEYAQSVVDAELGSQYVPAVAAGCPVNALLERSWKMSVQQ